MLDIVGIISLILTIVTTTSGATYAITRRLAKLHEEINSLKEEQKHHRKALALFLDTIIDTLVRKEIITDAEAESLRNFLRSFLPLTQTRYYTETVRESLRKLLDKDPAELTDYEVEQLKMYCTLLIMEAIEEGRTELPRYVYDLRRYIRYIECKRQRLSA